MHSSIFASKEESGATRAFLLLLAALVFYMCFLEVVTRIGFPRFSHIQRRITNERQEARALTPLTPEGAKTVLLVGNSLLVHGVDPTRLRREAAPEYETSVYAVENTQYLDWQFGIRRLVAEGSHPAVLVVCLSTRQLISKGTDSDYFAHYMMQERDLLEVQREASLNLTGTSDYFFAGISAWLGSRASIRNWLLLKLMPNADQLLAYFPEKAPVLPSGDALIEKSLRRLSSLQSYCDREKIRFIFLIPPSPRPSDLPEDLKMAAERVGITVMVPYQPAEMPASYFEDGFHMNPQGAAAFTERLAKMLHSVELQN